MTEAHVSLTVISIALHLITIALAVWEIVHRRKQR